MRCAVQLCKQVLRNFRSYPAQPHLGRSLMCIIDSIVHDCFKQLGPEANSDSFACVANVLTRSSLLVQPPPSFPPPHIAALAAHPYPPPALTQSEPPAPLITCSSRSKCRTVPPRCCGPSLALTSELVPSCLLAVASPLSADDERRLHNLVAPSGGA